MPRLYVRGYLVSFPYLSLSLTFLFPFLYFFFYFFPINYFNYFNYYKGEWPCLYTNKNTLYIYIISILVGEKLIKVSRIIYILENNLYTLKKLVKFYKYFIGCPTIPWDRLKWWVGQGLRVPFNGNFDLIVTMTRSQ